MSTVAEVVPAPDSCGAQALRSRPSGGAGTMTFMAGPIATLPTVPLAGAAPARRPAPGRVLASLAVALIGAATLVATYVVAVLEPAGRRLDDAVMTAAMQLGSGWRPAMLTVLDVVAVPTVALAVLGLVAPAVARGQGRRAGAVVALVLGSQVVTQVLKAVLPRSGDVEGNSLPSGHVTLVVALGVALVVVLPRVLRPLAAVAAAGAAALAGVATMVAGWHRPSDLVAAAAVVTLVGGLVGAHPKGQRPPGARASTTWST